MVDTYPSGWQVLVAGVERYDVEVLSVKWGYAFPRSCTLRFPGRHDEGLAYLTNNQGIKILDISSNIIFDGVLAVNRPQGINTEGVIYECHGLEEIANRYICKFNTSVEYTYNVDGMPDHHSESFFTHRWTVGEVMLDVLEHALGLLRFYGGGGIPVWTEPLLSSIPWHHPYYGAVTDPYLPTDVINDYNSKEIFALDLELSETKFNSQRLWDVLQTLIQKMDNHGIYIDPSSRELIVHDYTTSSATPIYFGVVGDHIEDTEITPGYPLAIDNKISFDVSKCKTKIIIEGKGQIAELRPVTWGGMGTMREHWEVGAGEDGKRWIINMPMNFTPLWEGDLTGDLRSPTLFVNGVPCTEDFVDWNLQTGVCTTATDLQGLTVEIWAYYLTKFQIIAGPGGTAYDNYNVQSELAYYDDTFLHQTIPTCERYNLISTFNAEDEVGNCAYGVNTQEMAGEEYCVPMPGRDDTAVMQAIANAILAQTGDEKIFATVVLDGIDLTHFTIQNTANFIGLAKWSGLNAQIMSIEIQPEKSRMVLEITNDIYTMPGYAEWKRRFMSQHEQIFQRRLFDAMRHQIRVGGNSEFRRVSK